MYAILPGISIYFFKIIPREFLLCKILSFKNILFEYSILFKILCIFLIFVPAILASHDPDRFRNVPENYFHLTIFTIGFSVLLGMYCCGFSKTSVFTALFLTFIMFITLTIYAVISKEDFTVFGGVLSTSLTLLIFATILNIFLSLSILYWIILVSSLIIFSSYIVYDTQLIIGNKTFSFSEDDYILAAMNLYTDIISLFMDILGLGGRQR